VSSGDAASSHRAATASAALRAELREASSIVGDLAAALAANRSPEPHAKAVPEPAGSSYVAWHRNITQAATSSLVDESKAERVSESSTATPWWQTQAESILGTSCSISRPLFSWHTPVIFLPPSCHYKAAKTKLIPPTRP
jgi:hypothetical protein